MYFEDFKLGQKFPGRSITVTETHVVMYGHLAGDLFWFHMNKELARERTPWKERIAHGMLTASLMVPNVADIVGDEAATHLGEHFNFRAPVLIGDTISSECEIVGLEPKKNWGLVRIGMVTRNQRGEVVLESESVMGAHYRPKI